LVRLGAYGLAVLSVAAAGLLTGALWKFVQPSATPLFFVAIMVCTMNGGFGPGLTATVLSTLTITYFFTVPAFSFEVGLDDAFRLALFAIVAALTTYIQAARRRAEEGRKRTLTELQGALAKIQTLSDLLPICPHCKRIRDQSDGQWRPFDAYVDQSSTLKVSHALCPRCAAEHYAEYVPARPQ
jgi:K+-sensing histidine kinase KdpD